MSSLWEQMDLLKQQQEILLKKIKEEEEKNRKESLTLNKLEELNNKQNIALKKPLYQGILSKAERRTNLITNPRFEIILEILKRQDNRIAKLEEIIETKNNDMYKKLWDESKKPEYDTSYELPTNR